MTVRFFKNDDLARLDFLADCGCNNLKSRFSKSKFESIRGDHMFIGREAEPNSPISYHYNIVRHRTNVKREFFTWWMLLVAALTSHCGINKLNICNHFTRQSCHLPVIHRICVSNKCVFDFCLNIRYSTQ